MPTVLEIIDNQTRRYLAGVVYGIWRTQALAELMTPGHGAIGLVMLQQHAQMYAEQSALPDLLTDIGKLTEAASMRAQSEQIFSDESVGMFKNCFRLFRLPKIGFESLPVPCRKRFREFTCNL